MDSTFYLRQTLTINAAQIKRLLKILEKSDMISSQILRGQGKKYWSKKRSFKMFR